MIALGNHWSSVFIGWPIRAMYSGVWTLIREDSVKSRERLEASSVDGRLKALATLFATTAALLRVLNLTVPSDISLLKMDSALAVITSQLIIELKALVVIVVYDSFLSFLGYHHTKYITKNGTISISRHIYKGTDRIHSKSDR